MTAFKQQTITSLADLVIAFITNSYPILDHVEVESDQRAVTTVSFKRLSGGITISSFFVDNVERGTKELLRILNEKMPSAQTIRLFATKLQGATVQVYCERTLCIRDLVESFMYYRLCLPTTYIVGRHYVRWTMNLTSYINPKIIGAEGKDLVEVRGEICPITRDDSHMRGTDTIVLKYKGDVVETWTL